MLFQQSLGPALLVKFRSDVPIRPREVIVAVFWIAWMACFSIIKLPVK